MNGYKLPISAQGLVAALAVGLVIGLEHGWHDRDLPEGGRVTGFLPLAQPGLPAPSLSTYRSRRTDSG